MKSEVKKKMMIDEHAMLYESHARTGRSIKISRPRVIITTFPQISQTRTSESLRAYDPWPVSTVSKTALQRRGQQLTANMNHDLPCAYNELCEILAGA